MINLLANVVTLGSLFSGFVSLIFSLEAHFTLAAWAVIISVALDGLDGQIARMNPAASEFGRQLDSLVDVVTFGIAPAVLGYIFVYQEFHLWATGALFIYLSCSVVRLARYNIMPKTAGPKYYFSGLPTTASGGALASFILIYRGYTKLPPPLVFLLLVAGLAYLMVSPVRYLNLNGIIYLFKNHRWTLAAVFALLGAALILFQRATGLFSDEIVIFTLFLLYLFSPLYIRSPKFSR